MKKTNNEVLFKVNNEFANDNCMQVFPCYKKNLTYIGNHNGEQKIMYHGVVGSNRTIKNLYLYDDRKSGFPYANISSHIERVGLRGKYIFCNQIINYEEPYISIVDGEIVQATAFKDGNDYYLHRKLIYSPNSSDSKAADPTRDELITYLETGYIDGIDEQEYEKVMITDVYGSFYNSELESEEFFLDYQKQDFIDRINSFNLYRGEKYLLCNIVAQMRDIVERIEYEPRIMVKFSSNGTVKLEEFIIIYDGNGEYELYITDIPVTKESLFMIRSNALLPEIKKLRTPSISLLLNPNISREELKNARSLGLSKK